MTIVGFEASLDQDQADQNVQPDLGTRLSTSMNHSRQKQSWKFSYLGRISRKKVGDRFIRHSNS